MERFDKEQVKINGKIVLKTIYRIKPNKKTVANWENYFSTYPKILVIRLNNKLYRIKGNNLRTCYSLTK